MTYAKYEGGQMVELACKGCGILIGKLVPNGNQTVRRQGNQTFVQERMVFQLLPNYREVELAMNDGHRHVTNLCVDCMEKRGDMEFMGRMYEADVAQWEAEGVTRDKIEPPPLPGSTLAPATEETLFAKADTALAVMSVDTVAEVAPVLRAPIAVLSTGNRIQ